MHKVLLSHSRNKALGSTGEAQMYGRTLRLAPLILVLVYLTLTVMLFRFGPIPWPVKNGAKLYFFLGLAHLALLLGYLSSCFQSPGGYYGSWRPSTLVRLGILVSLILLLPTSFSRTGSLVPNVVSGILQPGAAYASSHDWRQGNSAVIEYARILCGPLLILVHPLLVYYWSFLKRAPRTLGLFVLLGYVAIYISMGTNKGIFDFVLLTAAVGLAAVLSGSLRLGLAKATPVLVTLLLVTVGFFVFFTNGQLSRYGSSAGYGYVASVGVFADPDNFLIRRLSDSSKAGATSLVSYVTQGYYGLSLSLDEPFEPMFGMGHSDFLFRQVTRVMPTIVNAPYPVRIEVHGWDSHVNWSSIYPWLASDLSFPGVVIFMFVLGRLFAACWLDTLRGKNPFAVVMFSQFVIMFFYFSANHQVAQTGEGFVGFYSNLILWLMTRRKYVWGSKPIFAGVRDSDQPAGEWK